LEPRLRSVRRLRPLLVALAAAALASSVARRVAAYRPFDGTDAAVAELYNLEFEIGPVGYLRDRVGPALVAPALVANAGVLDDLELVAEARDVVYFPRGKKATAEIVDAAFDVKYVLRDGVLQDKKGPSIAAEASFLIPTLDRQKAGIALRLIVSEQAAPGTIHLNLQGGIDNDKKATLEGGFIVEAPDTWAARPVGELAFEVHAKGEKVVSGLAVDLAARLGDDDGQLFGELRGGFTWTLPFAKTPEKRKPQDGHDEP
jgi:hypothetical protein